jgi:hypothetical protein
LNTAPLATPTQPQRILVRLVLPVLGAIVATAALSAAALAVTGRHGWWGGWTASLLVSLIATGLSLAPLVLGVRAGAQSAAYGYLGGAVARVLATIFGVLAAVFVFRVSGFATLVLILPLYFAALIAECAALWRVMSRGGTEVNQP